MNNIKVLLTIFIILVGLSLPTQSNAQFWKKKKEVPTYPKEESNANTYPQPLDEKLLKIKKTEIEINKKLYPESVKKEKYRIDIILPFEIKKYAESGKRNSARFPTNYLPIINFYEGVLLAAEELNNEHSVLDIYIQDVGENNDQIKNFLQKSNIKQSDLIIGLLQSDYLKPFGDFAKKEQINFLSALSPSDGGIKDNPFFTVMQPDLQEHIDQLAAFALNKYPTQPFILLYEDETEIQKESKTLIENAVGKNSWKSLSVDDFIKDSSNLLSLIDSQQKNIIFSNSLSASQANSLLKKLNDFSNAYELIVFGMPSWKHISDLKRADRLLGMNIYYSTPFYFDHESINGVHLSEIHKKKYGKSPNEMTFRGYEMLYWSTHLLDNYGNIFNKNINDSKMAPFTQFQITPIKSAKGNVDYLRNESLNIFHYYNGVFNLAQ